MKPTLKERKIIRLLRLSWESLNSHLSAIYSHKKIPRKLINVVGGKRFDKKCVRDYAEMIKTLADLL